jgi:hypothetical protein
VIKSLISIIAFLKHPVEEFADNYKIGTKIKWLFFLLLIDLILMYILIFFQNLPVKYGFIDNDQNLMVQRISKGNIYFLTLIVSVAAPIMEELIFRLPLRLKKYNFIPFILIVLLLNSLGIINHYTNGLSWYYVLPVFITVLALIVVFTPTYFSKISTYLKSKYGWYFYFIALLFGFYHLINYRFTIQVLFFAPLLVLPQIVAGLLLGYIRIRFGFIWGILLHAIHNLLFILPVYLMMNSGHPGQVLNISKDGYTIEIKEATPGILTERKIAPNEIILSGTLKDVISNLTMRKTNNIGFDNRIKGEKWINVHFKNDSAYTSSNTDTARALALQQILEKYNLKIESVEKWGGVYELSVVNQNLFQNCLSKGDSVEKLNYIRNFYGKNDTIKLANTNSDYLRRALELNFGIFVENDIDKNLCFSADIPNGKIRDTAKFLETNYGIGLKRNRAKKEFLIVR